MCHWPHTRVFIIRGISTISYRLNTLQSIFVIKISQMTNYLACCNVPSLYHIISYHIRKLVLALCFQHFACGVQ